MFRNWLLAAGMAGLAAGLWVPARAEDAPESLAALTCTNPASGASWLIKIDYRNATVDFRPAKITRSEISWFDPEDGGSYTLDRQSGNLTASIASSTGGYFRYARCRPEKSR